ncbi:hypothetical protein K491DRAFT_410576 [Lophiostoma macrostomum CBS 122681]|uniref:Zn(2)-C6 fungal-type domain-containing protein n=1 Tax=Lophiostoma macrostomum CBS 122681 TaxID=1314788 RepID=A0A6A6TAS2_9PLEO|nr:hypothetical protein K491DRAFT_410576 [Lophiostoma macrostomum CBS 122681]
MPTKLAACDPCRRSKLACDHVRPVCSRCRDRDRAPSCTYRPRPFKKKSRQLPPVDQPGIVRIREPLQDRADSSESLANLTTRSRVYPNPGYLGSSSHTTFFDHLPPEEAPDMERSLVSVKDSDTVSGAKFIEQLHQSTQIPSFVDLVRVWLEKGVNLALAGPFTKHLADTMRYLFVDSGRTSDAMSVSKQLFSNTCLPLTVNDRTNFQSYCVNFCRVNARWETLGLFFVAVARAVADVPFFEPLHICKKQRRDVQSLAMLHADRCLEISLSLDCLNDLQLFLQYENFIIHAQMDGDQSYHSWRKLGDVISSLFALGYHENVGNETTTPSFLRNLRRAAFARAYSADKNVSIFLGRPPRLLQKYCHFELPGYGPDHARVIRSSNSHRQFNWAPDEDFNYGIDTRWSALCAVLKEEALDLFRMPNYTERAESAQRIQADAEAQWSALPERFRLDSPLKSYDCQPKERDFLVSARLNHLHVLVLTHLALQRRSHDPDGLLVSLSALMLSIVTEAIMLKEHLANSGTSLVWKVRWLDEYEGVH